MLTSFVFQIIYSIAIKNNPNSSTDYGLAVREELYNMFFVQNILMTAILVYFFIFFRTSCPPTPPSFAATISREEMT